jgi:hypothetical protein
VGDHKTSMLQDLEGGRPLEIEALIGAILEIGRPTGTQTPAINAVYAPAKLLNKTTQAAGLEQSRKTANLRQCNLEPKGPSGSAPHSFMQRLKGLTSCSSRRPTSYANGRSIMRSG